MKFFRFAAIVGLLVVGTEAAGTVAALASAPAVPDRSFELSAPAAMTMPAPQVCQLAIVEDATQCGFAIVVSQACAGDVAARLDAAGLRMLASDTFMAACASPLSAPRRPPLPD